MKWLAVLLIVSGGSLFGQQSIYTYPGSGGVTQTVQTKLPRYVDLADFGAKGNGSTDDTTKIQRAFDTVCSGGTCTAQIRFAGTVGNQFYITDQLNGYNSGTNTPYSNLQLIGAGKSTILWHGVSTKFALRTIGQFPYIENIKIQDAIATGWKAGYAYDGAAGIGSSTGGLFNGLTIECAGYPGGGVQNGPGGFQADQAVYDKLYVVDCYSGNAFSIDDPNAVSISIVGGSLGHSHAGVKNTANSNTISLSAGTELDDNDINFWPSLGGYYNYGDFRSEGSRRLIWTAGASASQSVSMKGCLTGAYNDVRPTTTVTGTATTATITMSCPAYTTGGPCFTEGDYVNIAGAGPAGATLNTAITALSGTTLMTATLSNTISTSVSGAAMTLDVTGAHLIMLFENAGGPYLHESCMFLNSFISGRTGQIMTASAGNAQTFISNTWAGYGTLATSPFAAGAVPASSVFFGNVIDNGAESGGPFYPNDAGGMPQRFTPNTLVTTTLTPFTPVLKFCPGAVPASCVEPTGIMYTTQSGWWRTLNGQTTAYIYITLSTLGTGPGATDRAVITGSTLPASATSGGVGSVVYVPSTFTGITAPLGVRVEPGATYVTLSNNSIGGQLTFNAFQNTSHLEIAIPNYD